VLIDRSHGVAEEIVENLLEHEWGGIRGQTCLDIELDRRVLAWLDPYCLLHTIADRLQLVPLLIGFLGLALSKKEIGKAGGTLTGLHNTLKDLLDNFLAVQPHQGELGPSGEHGHDVVDFVCIQRRDGTELCQLGGLLIPLRTGG